MTSIRAVIFDLGGVVVHSPLIVIAAYEKELGLPHDYLNVQITSRGRSGAWQRFERGEIHNILDFYMDFGRELSDTVHGNAAYLEYLKKNRSASKDKDVLKTLPKKILVDGRELFGRMMRESAKYDDIVVEAISRIRASNRFLVISVTNNFIAPYELLLNQSSTSSPETPHFSPQAELAFLGWSNGVIPPGLRDMFDIFIDSSEVGMRKPERGIYELALKRAGEGPRLREISPSAESETILRPEEVVMLDDLGMNLKAAREIGMKTIHVPIGGSQRAIEQLETMLGIPLLSVDNTPPPIAKL